MSDHAETIRLREVSEALLEAWRATDPEDGPPPAYYEFRDTVQPESVLALLAERQQAIDALREISQARSFRGPSVMGETVEGLAGFARAALVKLGEKP